jgi:hypothetical protein
VTFCPTSAWAAFPAGGEDFQAHIVAGLGPFVALLCQLPTGQADDGVAAREDADHAGAARISLFSRSFGLSLKIGARPRVGTR